MNFTLPSIPSAIPEKFLYSLDASRSSFALSRSESTSPSNTLTSFSIPSSLNWIIPLFNSAAPESSCSTPDTNAPVLFWSVFRPVERVPAPLLSWDAPLASWLDPAASWPSPDARPFVPSTPANSCAVPLLSWSTPLFTWLTSPSFPFTPSFNSVAPDVIWLI